MLCHLRDLYLHALGHHPLFGPLTRAEWGRWGLRHADHHLRQFGA
jgi:hypothetical protein